MKALAFLLAFSFCVVDHARAEDAYQSSGVKVGEVTASSAIIWVRATRNPTRNLGGLRMSGKPALDLPAGERVETLEGETPGARARVRVRYGRDLEFDEAQEFGWTAVDSTTDFTHQFRLTGLEPATRYRFAAEVIGMDEESEIDTLSGEFETAPRASDRASVLFAAMTCQAYGSLDHEEGFHIYRSMVELRPKFYLSIGDNVYYDNDSPVAKTVALARYHWHRIFSLPRTVEFLRRVPGYWLKDDHDTLKNDSWPGIDSGKMAPLTFERGQALFLEQVPMGDRTYRRVRWGKGLELWLVEGRDFRSPNTMEDGPEKTIWGAEQKAWLKRTLLESDADWKILISPTPIIGPDRPNKKDNHANQAFQFEGDEFRAWVRENMADNFFIICGDRHWQFHSVHPETGLHEFSCGPASDEHASGTPGEDPNYHRFHRVKGGFLSVALDWEGDRSRLAFRFHDVEGNVVYSYAPR